MKRTLCRMLCLALLLTPIVPANAAQPDAPHEFLALMTFGGTQYGGDESSFIDSLGGVYYIDLIAEDLCLQDEETLNRLRTLSDDYKIGELTDEELAEFKRLTDGIEREKPSEYGIAACDAGILRQTVYRTLESGERQGIVLMTAGDSVCENMDKNAMILSAFLLDKMAFTHNLGRWSYLFPYGDKAPAYLSFERGSYFGGSRTYALRREGDRVFFTALGMNGDKTDVHAEFDDAEGLFSGGGIVAELNKLIADEHLAAWNGFDERDDEILDGDGFSLLIDYGTNEIRASGYERYPEGYQAALSALEGFFGDLILRAEAQS